MVEQPSTFFVYGTLKRGQSNHRLIAAVVLSATAATVRGRLYDLGPFPALAEGDETVRGELLAVAPESLPRLLPLLDDLEGYDVADPRGSMYLRRVVVAAAEDGQSITAYAYFYNRDASGLRHLPGGVWDGPSAPDVADRSPELTEFGRHVREFRG